MGHRARMADGTPGTDVTALILGTEDKVLTPVLTASVTSLDINFTASDFRLP
jgi:hypothetical protein